MVKNHAKMAPKSITNLLTIHKNGGLGAFVSSLGDVGAPGRFHRSKIYQKPIKIEAWGRLGASWATSGRQVAPQIDKNGAWELFGRPTCNVQRASRLQDPGKWVPGFPGRFYFVAVFCDFGSHFGSSWIPEGVPKSHFRA